MVTTQEPLVARSFVPRLEAKRAFELEKERWKICGVLVNLDDAQAEMELISAP